ncbi:hypothetical protein D6D24_04013 [Aureobasidium pullulans]|uniref:A-kinase anchor protein 7-like phosphoesterase domain-containing protein n=1 Tax=Aureobasidium pullulans TaxID=5580 RepID=A0A4S8VYF4_AURPU|nr:hypothetical protein D6D24_04013 [Aureobasidium pullulans]
MAELAALYHSLDNAFLSHPDTNSSQLFGNNGKGNVPKKPALTHFLCIPLVNSISKPQLEASVSKFKEDVCRPALDESVEDKASAEENDDTSIAATESLSKDATAPGDKSGEEINEMSAAALQGPLIPEKAVRPIGSLHLTLGVMSLDEEKLVQAQDLLQSLDLNKLLHEASTPTTKLDDMTVPATEVAATDSAQQSLKTDPLTISLESLEPMQSPRKTSILYVKPQDPTNRLTPLSQALRTAFTEAGLLVPDTRPLKLHATIVNTIYVKGRKRKGKSKKEGEKTATASPEHIKDDKTIQETTQPSSDTQPSSSTSSQPLTANTPSSGHGPSATSSLYLDATDLLPRYATHIWASDIPIFRIAICEMGVKKHVSADGKIEEAYKEVAVRGI